VDEAQKQRYAITLLDSRLREESPVTYDIRLRETATQKPAGRRFHRIKTPGGFPPGVLRFCE
jgi:hypothetical protein